MSDLDSWTSWLDDLPLHPEFDEGRDRLQEYMTKLVAERDAAQLFLDNSISKAPEPLRELGKYLADLLDEDQWPTAERFLNAALDPERLVAWEDVLAERERQINAEGWTPEHDDAHWKGEIADAAACYAILAGKGATANEHDQPGWWPWHWTWWRSTTRRRDLVKAGALILAEIERLDRAALKGGAV